MEEDNRLLWKNSFFIIQTSILCDQDFFEHKLQLAKSGICLILGSIYDITHLLTFYVMVISIL